MSREDVVQEEYMRIFRPGLLSYVSDDDDGEHLALDIAEERTRLCREGFTNYQEAESFVDGLKDFHPQIDLRSGEVTHLNRGQRRAYDFISKLIADPESHECRSCILHGVGGTGKTYVIKLVIKHCHEMFGDGSICVMAPTGNVAAPLLYGMTIHSALRLPAPLTEATFGPLEGDALAVMQDSFRGVDVVIVEKLSMVGCRFMAAIDARVVQHD